MLSWYVETGNFSMSPGVEARFQRLDSAPVKRHGTAKIVADPDMPPWSTAGGKRGDVCELIANTGRLHLHLEGEKADSKCSIM